MIIPVAVRKITLLCFVTFFPEREILRFVFFGCIQKPKCLTALLRMFTVMNVMRMDHPLQIPAAFGWTPFDALVNNDVVKNKIKNSVAEYTKAYGQHVRIINNK